MVLLVSLFRACDGIPTVSNMSFVQMTYSDFMAEIVARKVDSARIVNDTYVNGKFKDGTEFYVSIPEGDARLRDTLLANNVQVVVEKVERRTSLLDILIAWFPMLLLIGVWIWFMRGGMAGGKGGNGLMGGFNKSKLRLFDRFSQKPVTFADVAGIDEAKMELQEIVEFLKNPRKFSALGAQIPKGCLLVGPPGTGKTLLARAVAGEANVSFFTISGSDFVEMFVGVGASRVRDMFEQGKKHAPCIIFIDEIDALGRHRGAGIGGGIDAKEQTLNQLLTETAGIESNEGVILIAATNRPDVLDPALLRPGRFDRQIVVPKPDINGRIEILKVHMKKTPLAPDVNPAVIARGTPGFAGADLANLINEAALLAARQNRKVVTMSDFEEAKDKVMMGMQRRSVVITDYEKRVTAYHEAGHAIVGHYIKGNEPIHKVTIIPRGLALGVTFTIPKEDRYMVQKQQLEARLAMAFGGRVAEELKYGVAKITAGAANDIKVATDIARSMVTEFGMSETIGPIHLEGSEREVFLGRSITERKGISEETARLIDAEVKKIIFAAQERAHSVLQEHRGELDVLASALLEYETLSGEEVAAVLLKKTSRVNEKRESGNPEVGPHSSVTESSGPYPQ